MRVLFICGSFNPLGTGEGFLSFKFVQSLSSLVHATIITSDPRVDEARGMLPQCEFIHLPVPDFFPKTGSIAWRMKPHYFWFFIQARKWIRANDESGTPFDVIHQLNPFGMRYPSPAIGAKRSKIVLGPVAGSLPTPISMRPFTKEPWWVKLRSLDRVRMRFDPYLVQTYRAAHLVLGAAGYVRDLIPEYCREKFKVMHEVGVDRVSPRLASRLSPEPLKLLFVGRLISTKGVSMILEALAGVDRHAYRLDIVGDGEERPRLENQAIQMGLSESVSFHGRIPRSSVDNFYSKADVFVFPSYREPSGTAIIEAMSWGLPVIGIAYGGPEDSIDSSSGVLIQLGTRTEMVLALRQTIESLIRDSSTIDRYSKGAIRTIERSFLWSRKAEFLLENYKQLSVSGDRE